MEKEKLYEVDEDIKLAISITLNKFLVSDDIKLNLPDSFNSKERKYAKIICQSLGIKSRTFGKGTNKFVLCVKDENILNLEKPIYFSMCPESVLLLSDFINNSPIIHKERLDLLLRTEKYGNPLPENVDRIAVAGKVNIGFPQITNRIIDVYDSNINNLLTELIKLNQVVIIKEDTYYNKYEFLKCIMHNSKINENSVRIIFIQNNHTNVINSANYFSKIINEKIGQSVGYQVRLENKVSPTTVTTFCTPWAFIRNIISLDIELSRITHIIIDNLNDRSKEIDLMLTYFELTFLPKNKHIKLILFMTPFHILETNLLNFFKSSNIETDLINACSDISLEVKDDCDMLFMDDALKMIENGTNIMAEYFKFIAKRNCIFVDFNKFLYVPNCVQSDSIKCKAVNQYVDTLNKSSFDLDTINNTDNQELLDKALEEIWNVESYLNKRLIGLETFNSIMSDIITPGSDQYKILMGRCAQKFIDTVIKLKLDVVNLVHSKFDINILMLCSALGLNECLLKLFTYMAPSHTKDHDQPTIAQFMNTNDNLEVVGVIIDRMKAFRYICGLNRFCSLNGWTLRDWAKYYNQDYTVSLIDATFDMAELTPFEEARIIHDNGPSVSTSMANVNTDYLENNFRTIRFYQTLCNNDDSNFNYLNYFSPYQEVLMKLVLTFIDPLLKESSAETIPDNVKVLIFLPSYDEIYRFKEVLIQHSVISAFLKYKKLKIFSIHVDMESSELTDIYETTDNENIKKIFLATEFAENAVQVPHIDCVIDSGLIEEEYYDACRNESQRRRVWISRERFDYRRKCLKSKGTVFRPKYVALYSKARYDYGMYSCSIPEFYRADLSEIILQAKYMLPNNYTLQEFFNRSLPFCHDHETVIKSSFVTNVRCMIQNLKNIDVFDDCLDLTECGQHCLDIPIHPKYAKMLLHSLVLKCLDPALTLVAILAFSNSHIGGSSFGLHISNNRLIAGLNSEQLKNKLQDSSNESKRRNSFNSDIDKEGPHIALIRTYQGWFKARSDNREDVYCLKNALSPVKLEFLRKMRSQLLGQMRASGLILPNYIPTCSPKSQTNLSFDFNSHGRRSNGVSSSNNPPMVTNNITGNFNNLMEYNTHSDSWPTLKACLTLGLYPNIVKIMNTKSANSGDAINQYTLYLSGQSSTFYTASSAVSSHKYYNIGLIAHQSPSLIKDHESVLANKSNLPDSPALQKPAITTTPSTSAALIGKNTNPDPRVYISPIQNNIAINDTSKSSANISNRQSTSDKVSYPSEWIIFDHYFPIITPNTNQPNNDIHTLPYGGFISGCTFVSAVDVILFTGSNRTPKEYIQDIENPDSLQNMASLILQEESDSSGSEEPDNRVNSINLLTVGGGFDYSGSDPQKHRLHKTLTELKLDTRLIFQQDIDVIRILLHTRQKYHALSLRRFKNPLKPWHASDEAIVNTVVIVLNMEERNLRRNSVTMSSKLGIVNEFNNAGISLYSRNFSSSNMDTLFNEHLKLDNTIDTEFLNNNIRPKLPPLTYDLSLPINSSFTNTNSTSNLNSVMYPFKYALLAINSDKNISNLNSTNLLPNHENSSFLATKLNQIALGKTKPPKMGNPEEFCNYPQLALDAKRVFEGPGSIILKFILTKQNNFQNFSFNHENTALLVSFVLNRQTKIFVGLLKSEFRMKLKAGPEPVIEDLKLEKSEWILKKLINIERMIVSSNTVSKLLSDWKLTQFQMPILEIDHNIASNIFNYFDSPNYKQYAGED